MIAAISCKVLYGGPRSSQRCEQRARCARRLAAVRAFAVHTVSKLARGRYRSRAEARV